MEEIPMPIIQNVLVIERPVDDVFAAITAFDRIPEWIPSIERAYVSSSGPTGVGTTFMEEANLLGRPLRIVGTITEYEPDHKLTYVYADGPVPGAWHYTFSPVPSGTQLDFRLEIPPGSFFSFQNPFLFLIFRRLILKNLESLKAWIEADYGKQAAQRQVLAPRSPGSS
jgi:uncharacterized protein YndB with AHSA1/START domain